MFHSPGAWHWVDVNPLHIRSRCICVTHALALVLVVFRQTHRGADRHSSPPEAALTPAHQGSGQNPFGERERASGPDKKDSFPVSWQLLRELRDEREVAACKPLLAWSWHPGPTSAHYYRVCAPAFQKASRCGQISLICTRAFGHRGHFQYPEAMLGSQPTPKPAGVRCGLCFV